MGVASKLPFYVHARLAASTGGVGEGVGGVPSPRPLSLECHGCFTSGAEDISLLHCVHLLTARRTSHQSF